ncbi:helix-turn-helix domain-containing protein [Desulfovibrio inopinatus]|uniref:helix-turn-helix domain-containing protein n=1 Tax=Desulfovibrio inopinatus TaxID=102109 RepID=UPI00041FAC45|nr:helix-turn-helix transcriptional regulator [Desulfovibrio inopinatus]
MKISEQQRQHLIRSRKDADMTFCELNQITGLKPSELSMIESGHMDCDQEAYKLICDALGVEAIESSQKNVTNVPTSKEHSPHVSGEAICLSCKHEWVAVVPVGTTWLKCPNCGLLKGTGKYPVVPEMHWLCTCGTPIFYITQKGAICPMCGTIQAW